MKVLSVVTLSTTCAVLYSLQNTWFVSMWRQVFSLRESM